MSNGSVMRWELKRRGVKPETAKPAERIKHLPARRGVFLIAIGNSAEEVALRLRALAWKDGYDVPILFLNNDIAAPNVISVRLSNGQFAQLIAEDRFVIGGEGNARDQIKDHPLLAERYLRQGLLRGISVFETYPRGGHGGHSLPIISALDLDLHCAEVYAFLRKGLAWLRDGNSSDLVDARSDIERLIKQRTQMQRVAAEAWNVVIIGGGSGSCGNAGHQLLPYQVREILRELGVGNYELTGVVLGPRAFTGLTPNVTLNYYALLQALDFLAQHGQRRRYINGLTIDAATPPYNQVILFDDPWLPREGATVSERELNVFFARAALSLHLWLNTQANQVIASRTANPRADRADENTDERVRMFATLNGAVAGADKDGLIEIVALKKQAQLFHALLARLEA
ncbi:MAG: hypothetical protein HZC40_08065 [Chloroflexi bacterium]|nr:hypothetical protein [Chloroflexota bacterium]